MDTDSLLARPRALECLLYRAKKERGMNMTCFFCKGKMKPGTTIHTVQLKNCVVVIKNVPCMKCEQCGEVILSADTIEKIERILQTVEKAVAEIMVVNFPDCAS